MVIARGRPHWGRKAAFAELKRERDRLMVEFSDAPPLPAELAFAQYGEWLAPDDPRLKRSVEDDEPGYGWTRFDEGGFLRITWAAEQERDGHDQAELATRGRRTSTIVRPLWLTGPNVAHAPFRKDPAMVSHPAASAKPFVYDVEAWLSPLPFYNGAGQV